jgi:hypothetical protein
MTGKSAPLVASISFEELTCCMDGAAPPLPWRGADGREACSFILVRRPPQPPLLAFLDAHGEVIPDLADNRHHPIARTVMACNPAYGQVVFLPRSRRSKPR